MIELNWAGGEHTFALRIGELQALQDATGEGPGASLHRLYQSLQVTPMFGGWKVADVTDTVRLGLIGGGMERTKAAKLVREAIERAGIVALVVTASDILIDALSEKDPEPGEAEGEPDPAKNGTSGE
jgi:Phage tail tube protein, GTA-gp10